MEKPSGQGNRRPDASPVLAFGAHGEAGGLEEAAWTHEVRTPLAAVVGLSRELAARAADPQSMALAAELATAADHLSTLLARNPWQPRANPLPDPRPPPKEQAPAPGAGPVRLGHIIHESLQIVQARQHPALRFDVRLAPPATRPLSLDGPGLRQALVNLLTNAIKHTPEGTITVRARLRRLPRGSHMLHIQVSDDGTGMSEGQRAQLFRPFHTDGRRFRGIEGTGLGLVIVRRIVEDAGGTVRIRSAPGDGTTVHLELPVERPAQPRRKPAMRRQRSLHILLVDDDRLQRTLGRSMLEAAGHTCTLADSAAEAVEVLARAPCDAAILDWNLPDGDGASLARALRALRPGLPVICLSGHDPTASGAPSPFDAHLLKPVHPWRLQTTLIRLVDREGA